MNSLNISERMFHCNAKCTIISLEAVQIKWHLILRYLKVKFHLFHLLYEANVITASLSTKNTDFQCYDSDLTHQTVINTSYSHIWLTFLKHIHSPGPQWSRKCEECEISPSYLFRSLSVSAWKASLSHSLTFRSCFVLHYIAFTTTQWLLCS